MRAIDRRLTETPYKIWPSCRAFVSNDFIDLDLGNDSKSNYCCELIVCYACVVKVTPGTLQEGGASFATTHWSEVARCALTDVPEATDALARLCEMYWPPIYSFIRRRGYSPPDAQDLTQSFFAFFLRTKAYAGTDRLHGANSGPSCSRR